MLKKVNNFLHQKTLISVFMSFIYAALTFVWVQHHELWADEVNVYLILKNLSFGQALMHISAEGHPFLFYMLCLPFVKMGFSMFSVQMICHAACSAAVFILFRFSPFPFVLNLLFSLSAGMFYFFPVICRSYSILPLLLLLLAALYPKIKENNADCKYVLLYAFLIACAANTHIVMYGFAVSLALLFFCDTYKKSKLFGETPKKILSAYFVLLLGLIPPIFTVFIGLSKNSVYRRAIPEISYIYGVCKKIIVNFYDFISPDLSLREPLTGIFAIFASSAVILIIIMFFFYLKKKSAKMLYAALFSVFFQIGIYIVSYSYILPYRILLIPLILFFFSWISFYEKKEDSICQKYLGFILAALFIISIPGGLYAISRDYKENFSSAKEMAEYIKSSIPDTPNTYIFATVPANALGIAYYLDKQPIYDYEKRRIYCYTPSPDFFLKTSFNHGDKVYLILYKEEEHLLNQFKVMYKTKHSILAFETFYLVSLI